MPENSIMKQTPKKVTSGGFWRRGVALFIDLFIILGIYQAVGIYFYQHSNGLFRMTDSFVSTSYCNSELGLIGPNESKTKFRVDKTKFCTYYFLGIEYNHTKEISQIDTKKLANGVITTNTQFERYYIDKSGKRVNSIEIDGLKGLSCFLILSLSEAIWGTTIGKRMMCLKVISATGEKVSAGRAIVRNLYIFGGASAMGLVNFLPVLGIRLDYTNIGFFIIGILFILAWIFPFFAYLFFKPDPLYDRWSKTKVVEAFKMKKHTKNASLA